MQKERGKRMDYNEAGRRIGEGHPMATYSDFWVSVMLDLLAAGVSRKDVAKALGMPYSTVSSIARGRTRRQVMDPWRGR